MTIHIIKRKSGHRYQVLIRDTSRRQISKTFKRRNDTEKWEREQLRKRDFPETVQEESRITFKKLMALYRKRHLKNTEVSRQERYNALLRLHILPTFGKRTAADIRIVYVEVPGSSPSPMVLAFTAGTSPKGCVSPGAWKLVCGASGFTACGTPIPATSS